MPVSQCRGLRLARAATTSPKSRVLRTRSAAWSTSGNRELSATPAPTSRNTSASDQPSPARPAAALVDFARRVADEHEQAHGQPITRDKLRARLGISNQLASDLLHQIRTT